MSAAVGLGAALAGAALVARWAYRLGRRRRGALLPPEILQELAAHKRECLGEPSERVALELELLFGREHAGRAARRPAHALSAPGRVAARSCGRDGSQP